MQLGILRGRSLAGVIGIGVAVLGISQAAGAAMAAAAETGARCSLATLNGTYTMAAQGMQIGGSSAGPFAYAAMQTFDGKGGTKGVFSASFNGQIVRGQSFTGTYTVKPDCTGTETDFVGGSPFGHYDEFLSPDGNLATLSATDDGTVLSGTMYRVPLHSKT
jgi:hypothetical protein